MTNKQCLEVLGIKHDATIEEIRIVYIHLVKIWHPDRLAKDSDTQLFAQEKLKEINCAYDELRKRKPSEGAQNNHNNSTSTETDEAARNRRREEAQQAEAQAAADRAKRAKAQAEAERTAKAEAQAAAERAAKAEASAAEDRAEELRKRAEEETRLKNDRITKYVVFVLLFLVGAGIGIGQLNRVAGQRTSITPSNPSNSKPTGASDSDAKLYEEAAKHNAKSLSSSSDQSSVNTSESASMKVEHKSLTQTIDVKPSVKSQSVHASRTTKRGNSGPSHVNDSTTNIKVDGETGKTPADPDVFSGRRNRVNPPDTSTDTKDSETDVFKGRGR